MGYLSYISTKYGKNVRSDMDIWIKSQRRLVLLKEQRTFLIKCRKESLIPAHILNHTNKFKIHNLHYKVSFKLQNTKVNTQRKLLNCEINNVVENIQELGHISNNLKYRLLRNINENSLHFFFDSQRHALENLKFKVKNDCIRKFLWLKGKNFDEIVKLREFRVNRCFKNISNVQIPDEIAETLALGKKFGIPYATNKIPVNIIIANVESSIKNLDNDEIKLKIRKTVTELISNHNRNNKFKNIDKTIENLVNFQKNHKNLLFVNADKGNIMVAANRNDYNHTIENILKNNNLYKNIKTNLVPTVENKCNDIVSRWENKGYINESVAYRLKTHSSCVAKAYALPKVHKPSLNWRLIVSTIGSPTYNLSKYLSKILKPISRKTDTFVKNSLDLKNNIDKIIIPSSHSLVSLDVVSMFDNIPLDLALDCIEEKFNLNKNLTKISKNEILIAVRTVFNNTIFSFNNSFYKQLSGCPMGSPLSPIVSNLVMEDVEKRALSKLSFKPILYKRYVDDILTVIPTNNITELFNIFNSIDDSIQFTLETEKNNKINFLDLEIQKTENGKLITNWYKKPSWSGNYLNFKSHHMFNQKIGLIKGLVDRGIKLSDKKYRKENLDQIKSTLLLNNYPLPLIENVIKERIHEIYNSSIVEKKKTNWLKNYNRTDIKISLPYIQGLSERLRRSLKKYNINVYFKNDHTLEKLLRNKKDSDNIENLSNVVYSIKCTGCKKVYIGETGRRLKNRIYEHKRDCRIGNLNTGLSQHSWKFDHVFDFDNIKILARENNTFKRRILESIHINKYIKNSINLKTEIMNINQIYQCIMN